MRKQDKEEELWEKIAFASFSQNQKKSASLLTQGQLHSALSRISQFDAVAHYKKTHLEMSDLSL